MVAIVTLISALEPFFNWRSRWVLMEETRYRLNRIRGEMDYYLVTTTSADLDRKRLRKFFADQQDVWHDVSRQWGEFRKFDQAQPGGASAPPTLDGGIPLPSGGRVYRFGGLPHQSYGPSRSPAVNRQRSIFGRLR